MGKIHIQILAIAFAREFTAKWTEACTSVNDNCPVTAANFQARRISAITRRRRTRSRYAAPHAPKNYRKRVAHPLHPVRLKSMPIHTELSDPVLVALATK
jgi:hypothetical protein